MEEQISRLWFCSKCWLWNC